MGEYIGNVAEQVEAAMKEPVCNPEWKIKESSNTKVREARLQLDHGYITVDEHADGQCFVYFSCGLSGGFSGGNHTHDSFEDCLRDPLGVLGPAFQAASRCYQALQEMAKGS